MNWNYRIVRHRYKNEEDWFAIHEVYYEADGKPKLVSKEPIAPQGGDVEELLKDMERQKEACKLPVLDYAVFDGGE